MRLILLGILVALLPVPAAATCSCVCVGGEARSLCSSPTELEPVCARICPQSLGARSVSPGPVTMPGSIITGGADGSEDGAGSPRGGMGLGGAGLGAASGLGGGLR
ncbi:hypothetical protein U8607_20820 [Methylobacterium durans]|uniref:hypothetical protein n=1 Tax=Methylobacterium durans TaxID=2202825 RepID=UPI002AFEC371|nr:hypothetical protein [Methylobacterium durans]MEA1834541.1 hypothetical protein [Methylobacterium durans]